LLSDDLPIFEELCRRSFKFIHNCFFHNSSLIRSVTRYRVLAGRYRSVIGSNFRLCISRFGVDERAFYDGLDSVDCAVKQCHSRAIDQKHVRTTEFLRESIVARDIVGRYGHLSFLTKSELSCVIDYLANS